MIIMRMDLFDKLSNVLLVLAMTAFWSGSIMPCIVFVIQLAAYLGFMCIFYMHH